LNDQDANLVDTQHVLARGVMAREVADGCFCCRFSEFLKMASELARHHADVIFAEPVGSCIDLTATVIRPLQTVYPNQLRLAPLTVLLDPLAAHVDPDIRYLINHQLAEADLVCTTRQDLHSYPDQLSIPVDFQLSGKTGFGVEAWLNEMLQTTRIVGARLLDVDYTRYAEAEAALGWLNLHAHVDLTVPQTPARLCGSLLDGLEKALTDAGVVIAHLKIFDRTPAGWIKVSICANDAEPLPEGDLLADAAGQHDLALNLRAIADPERLRQLVLLALEGIAGAVDIRHLRAFRPAAPKPEYRAVS
jgi:CobW/HypB/UreG, nucleotide-binding domain